jgi:hypothetical protein
VRAEIAAARSPIAAAAAVPVGLSGPFHPPGGDRHPGQVREQPTGLGERLGGAGPGVIFASPRDIVSPAISSSVSGGARPWPHAAQ